MSAYDLDESGAVLVRPDGYVGWRSRSKTNDPAWTLREAMAGMLGWKYLMHAIWCCTLRRFTG